MIYRKLKFSMTAGRKVNTFSQEWCTPEHIVNVVKDFYEGEIDLDPCSNKYSIVKAKTEFILPKHDGLKEKWNFKRIYVNPPYGRNRENKTSIKDWLKKCLEAKQKYNSEVIALIPVASNTSHWKEFIFGKADMICFLQDTRLKFMLNGEVVKKGASMACCIVYYGDRCFEFIKNFSKLGYVLYLYTFKR